MGIEVGFVEALLDFCVTHNHYRRVAAFGVTFPLRSESVGSHFHANVAQSISRIISHLHPVSAQNCAVVLKIVSS